MALIALTSAKGAPGVTTTALALSFAWHRPSLLVEADMSAASSVLSGYLRASTDPVDSRKGLPELSLANRRDELSAEALWDQVLKLGENRYLLAGLADPAQAAGMTSTWSPLTEHLVALESAGIDVFIDAGRLGAAYGPSTLLHRCDVVALVTSSRLPDIYALSRRAKGLAEDHAQRGGAALRVLIVGEGRPYTHGEIQGAVNLPAMSSIAWDPINAEVYSSGAAPGHRFANSKLALSINAAATELTGVLEQRRQQLAPRSSRVRHQLREAGRTDIFPAGDRDD